MHIKGNNNKKKLLFTSKDIHTVEQIYFSHNKRQRPTIGRFRLSYWAKFEGWWTSVLLHRQINFDIIDFHTPPPAVPLNKLKLPVCPCLSLWLYSLHSVHPLEGIHNSAISSAAVLQRAHKAEAMQFRVFSLYSRQTAAESHFSTGNVMHKNSMKTVRMQEVDQRCHNHI